ncbi:MAG TPA: rhodanese-like domain-containing protein [Polyangiaceae bacterium]|nr:rhodanese-like domain-containing protein [Polyangiaceae bacterium]
MFASPLTTLDPAPVSLELGLEELRAQLASPKPPLLAEILPPRYFEQGHLPGAINLPLEGFAAAATSALRERDAAIVVYCASETCQNSDMAARKLQALGYSNVRVFRGGKAAWKAARLPLET